MLLNRRGLMIAATQPPASSGGGGGTRGPNILVGKTVAPGTGVTYSDPTFTAAANSNVLSDWFFGVLSPSTSYTCTFDYNLSAGGGMKATDDSGNTFTGGAISLTCDGTNRSATISFTTTASVGNFRMAASGGLYGPGTVSNVYLSSP